MERIFYGGVERNMSSKIDEIMDSIYLEASVLKSKYKDLASGIIIDSVKFKHILSSLMSLFKAESPEELIKILNTLNKSKAPCVHMKFIFDKFNLVSVQNAVSSFMSRHGMVEKSSMHDSLVIISTEYPEFKSLVDELFRNIHLSRFEESINLDEYVDINYTPGAATVAKIMQAISRLEKIHKVMTPIIKKNFESMSLLSSKLESS